MCAGLLVTAAAAYAVWQIEAVRTLIFGDIAVFYGLIIAELALVFALSAALRKISAAFASVLFFLYAVVNGLTLSVVFLAYTSTQIYAAFGVAALTFAAMAAYGTLTRKDLSQVGSLCVMGLMGLLIATGVNFFLRNDMLDTILCYAGILIFIGLTAYDTRRIKLMLADAHTFNTSDQSEAVKKISVIGALSLYLDFINIFLRVLRLLGKGRR
jgi:FtsH-binding integral membrane protein